MEEPILCVEIKDAYKVFWGRSSHFHVINGLTLSLPRGTIYGLLGPSGCGKTTVLRCIMGRLEIDAGVISMFGNTPGFADSKSLIGYMPQETALIDNLTVIEIMRLYGNIYGMEAKVIESRAKFLIELLKIPHKNKRLICKLSGGQKRRASFAIALLHDPELLILDEPTVGVEPILRQCIWKHLASLVESKNTTIILTTHYIEEARMANNVGLMLNGQLLAEAQPEALIAQHGCKTLEQVFLKLCLNSDTTEVNFSKKDSKNILKEKMRETRKSEIATILQPASWELYIRHAQRVKALLLKNILIYCRTPVTVVTQIFIPSIVMFLYAFAIGKPLFNLPFAVVNHDKNGFGGLFLSNLNNRTLIQVPYSNFENAKQSTLGGDVVAAIYIGPDFTDSLTIRYRDWVLADDISINKSTMLIFVDNSNGFVSFTVYQELHVAFMKFMADVATDNWGMNPAMTKLPLKFADKQVHGNQWTKLDQYTLPAFFLCATYLLAVGLTSVASVAEKISGSYERVILAGVTFIDITLSDVLAPLVLMPLQILFMLLTAVTLCGISCEGSYVLVVFLIFFQGITGCCFGVLLSYCTDRVVGTSLLLAQFLASLISDGIFFPTESLPVYMQRASEFGIQKYPVEAMRDIINRGWGLTYAPVAIGFAVTLTWSSVFLIFAYVLFRTWK